MRKERARLAALAALSGFAVLWGAGCGAGGGDPDPAAGSEQGSPARGASGVVNVYSHRHYDTDKELFRRFTQETGIEVNVVTASADELITRLEHEGRNSPADLLITVDAGRLHRAKERNLLQPVRSETLEASIPAHLRDPDGHWFGLTERVRILAYARDRVDPEDLRSYEDLADPRWQGRVLVRSSENVYNQSLLASLIAADGEEAAARWARGVVGNMARNPSGGDTDQIKAVGAGAGDVAVVNSYYLARLQESTDPAERRIVEGIGVVFPNQADRGAHVNVSGAGVTASSRNRENTIRLLEYLVSPEAQRLFAEGNQEYPVNPSVEPSPTLRAWGEYRSDTLHLERLGELNARAVMLFDRAGWR